MLLEPKMEKKEKIFIAILIILFHILQYFSFLNHHHFLLLAVWFLYLLNLYMKYILPVKWAVHKWCNVQFSVNQLLCRIIKRNLYMYVSLSTDSPLHHSTHSVNTFDCTTDWVTGVQFLTGHNFSLHHRVWTDSGTLGYSWVLYSRVKQPGHETSQLPSSSAEIKNVWSYSFTPHTSLCHLALIWLQGWLFTFAIFRIYPIQIDLCSGQVS